MTTSHFKAVGQRMGDGKIAVVLILDDYTIDKDLPTIFEFQGAVMPKTIYSGTQPTIKFNMDTLVDRDEDKGIGLAGLVMETSFFNKDVKTSDPMGISLES
jgi:hypothetical protein